MLSPPFLLLSPLPSSLPSFPPNFFLPFSAGSKCIYLDGPSNLSSRGLFVCHFGNFSEIGILKIELISRGNFIACAWVRSLSPASIWHSRKVNQSVRFVILLHLRAELNNTWSEILIEVVGGYTVFNLMSFNSILFSLDAVILKVGSKKLSPIGRRRRNKWVGDRGYVIGERKEGVINCWKQ